MGKIPSSSAASKPAFARKNAFLFISAIYVIVPTFEKLKMCIRDSVDELLGEQQVVVKPLPSYLNSFNIKSRGIAGCTILGDGNISIILDVGNLYTPIQ